MALWIKDYFRKYKWDLLVSLILTLILMFPYIVRGFTPVEHDTFFHLSRIENLSIAIREGHFFPAIYPYENNGSFRALRDANIVSFVVGHDHINCSDIIYNKDGEFKDRAILSYGVKATDQVYHDKDMLGYKTITLEDISAEEFVTIENVTKNFKNVRTGAQKYD